MNENDEVDPEVFHLATLGILNGLLQLIEALGSRGILDDQNLRMIHDRLSGPLDDEKWRDNNAMESLRTAVDDALASARAMSSSFREGG